MKTKITKKSISIINEMIVKPYFLIYENLRLGLEEKRYRIYEETFTKAQARSWQFSRQFMPEQVQSVIRNEHLRCFKITATLEEGVTFSVYWFVNNSKKSKLGVDDKLLHALASMITMSQYSTCSLGKKQVVLRMFDTDIRKFFPEGGQTIGPEHVNSAYTTPCRYSESSTLEIVIFRNEEWQKVLFHELMHTYSLDIGLDTNYIKKSLSKIFGGLDCKFNLTEAYCEFWARAIWTMISSRETNDQQISLLMQQQKWAIKQASNVLLRMSHRSNSCNERTSAFSYYVITGFLLSAFPTVIEWCERNCEQLISFPNTQQGIRGFLQLIDDIVHSDTIQAKWNETLEQLGSETVTMGRVTSKMSYV